MTVFLVYTFREPFLLGRTVSQLAPYPVIVHIDAKVDEAPFRRAIADQDRKRVTFLPERIRVNWGGYSQVEAIRYLVRTSLKIAVPNEYLVLLSGQDYPIKPVRELEDLFQNEVGRQFLRYFEIAESEHKYTSQIDHRHHRDLRLLSGQTGVAALRLIRNGIIRYLEKASRALPALDPPAGFRVAHGVTHFAMTASFAADLESSVTPQIEAYFRRVFVPEEKFYQSLSANSIRGHETGGALHGGAEPYVGQGNWRYSNLHHIDPTLTKVYTEDDWDEVVASSKYFLRKLESGRSNALLTRIDEELLVPPENSREG